MTLKRFKDKDNEITIEYEGDTLKIECEADQINWDALKQTIARYPEDLDKKIWREKRVLQINEKVALFSVFYKEYMLRKTGHKVSYTPLKKDINALKQVPVSVPLLKAYFNAKEWWCKEKNIQNYIHNVNNVKALCANGGSAIIKPPKKSKFPDKPDVRFESKLKPDELQEYWNHLRSLGYEFQQKGGVRKWIKSS